MFTTSERWSWSVQRPIYKYTEVGKKNLSTRLFYTNLFKIINYIIIWYFTQIYKTEPTTIQVYLVSLLRNTLPKWLVVVFFDVLTYEAYSYSMKLLHYNLFNNIECPAPNSNAICIVDLQHIKDWPTFFLR